MISEAWVLSVLVRAVQTVSQMDQETDTLEVGELTFPQ